MLNSNVHIKVTLLLLLLVCEVFLPISLSQAQIAVDPNNTNWFIDGNKHVFLQGVSNDILLYRFNKTGDSNANTAIKMLDDVAAAGGNYVRVDAGATQNNNSFVGRLGQGRHHSMWLRTGPGVASDGELKYDLDQLNESYFDNVLVPFLAAARQRGIYVELTLFDANEPGNAVGTNWLDSVWNPINNINLDISTVDMYSDDLSVDGGNLLQLQKKYVNKVLEKTKPFGNVIYELFNESPISRPVSERWVREMIHHIESQGNFFVSIDRNVTNSSMLAFTPYPAETEPGADVVAVHSGPWTMIDFHLNIDYQNMLALGANKPVSMNEDFTNENGDQSSQSVIAAVRKKKWLAFMAGGHHNFFSFVGWIPNRPEKVLDMIKKLVYFIDSSSINFWLMEPNASIAERYPAGFAYCLANPGFEYIVYMLGTRGSGDVIIKLKAGSYSAVWYNPANGKYIGGTTDLTVDSERTITIRPPGGVFNQEDVVLYLGPTVNLVVLTSVLPDGMVGDQYSTNLLATGGLEPYSWSIVGGHLPDGLVLNSGTGMISGIPTKAGSFGFTVNLMDSQVPASSANKQLGIVVDKKPAPVILTVAPVVGVRGETLDASITGSQFQNGAMVSFSGDGIVVNQKTFVSSNELHANISITGTAPATIRSLTVTNPDGQSDTLPSAFTVLRPAPVVTAVIPGIGVQGEILDVSITGSQFQNGAMVSFSGEGIVIDVRSFISSTELNATIGITETAPATIRSLTVTNPDGQSDTLDSAFSVWRPAPVATTVEPDVGVQGDTLDVSITGSQFQNGAKVSFSGQGIVVNQTSFISSNELHANISITESAPATIRSLTVTNPDGQSDTLPSAFTVLRPAPVVTAVIPGIGVQGETLDVSITGSQFQNGAMVNFSGEGIVVNQTSFVSSNELHANISITGTAPATIRSLTVTNPDGQSDMLPSAFTVLRPEPVVTAVIPDIGVQGETVDVSITGSQFQNGAMISFSGEAIVVDQTSFISSSELSATISIAETAPATIRSLTLTNPDGQSDTLPSAFTVLRPKPVVTAVIPGIGVQGDTLDVSISGRQFQNGAMISFSGEAIVVDQTSFISSTELNATISITETAPATIRSLTVTNPDGQSDTLVNSFMVSKPPPVVILITPNVGLQGETINLTIIGKNFQEGATVSFSGEGIMVNEVRFVGSSRLEIEVKITGTAPATTRSVMVANPDGQSDVLEDAFTLLRPAPEVKSVTPDRGIQGTTIDVMILGNNFQTGEIVSFSGDGITVNQTEVIDSSELNANISIQETSPATTRSLTVTNPDGLLSDTLVDAFTILMPAPIVTSIKPDAGLRGDTLDVRIMGSNFQNGASLTFSGEGIIIHQTSFVNSLELKANIGIAETAAATTRSIRVTNPDDQFGDGLDIFKVETQSPEILSINPNRANQGISNLNITVTGRNFDSEAMIAFDTVGITVTNTNFIGPDQLIASISISATAPAGPSDVIVSNPTGNPARGISAFTIYPKGDVNNDMLVDVSDLIRVINIILNLGIPPDPVEFLAADLNKDNLINVNDLVDIVNIILGISRE